MKTIFSSTSLLSLPTVFLFVALWTSQSAEASLAKAERALQAEDYAKAFEFLQAEPDQDNPIVEFYLGALLFEGLGVERNVERGVALLEKSGRKNVKAAMVKLAGYYGALARQGQKQAEVFFWISKLANTKDAYWQRELAALYRIGIGTDKNPKQAYKWMLKSAQNGYGPATLDMYKFLSQGVGTRVNKDAARTWLGIAVKKNVDGAAQLMQELEIKERDAYQIILTKNDHAPLFTVNYGLACPECFDFFDKHFEYYLGQAEQGRLTLALNEMPWGLSGNNPKEHFRLLENIRTPSFYLQCIRAKQGNETAIHALRYLIRLAKANISTVDHGRYTSDWRHWPVENEGSMNKAFKSKKEMYDFWLKNYGIQASQCDVKAYDEYVALVETKNKDVYSNTYVFKGKKYMHGLLELPDSDEFRQKMRKDVEQYLKAQQATSKR